MSQLDQLVAAMHASRAIYKAQNEPSDVELSALLGEIIADEKRKIAAFDGLVQSLKDIAQLAPSHIGHIASIALEKAGAA